MSRETIARIGLAAAVFICVVGLGICLLLAGAPAGAAEQAGERAAGQNEAANEAVVESEGGPDAAMALLEREPSPYEGPAGQSEVAGITWGEGAEDDGVSDEGADGSDAENDPLNAPGEIAVHAQASPEDEQAIVEAATEGAEEVTAEQLEDAVAQGNVIDPQQLPDSSFIYDTSISDLDGADSYLNLQTVQVVGEVIGDRIRAEGDPGHCWLALQATDGTDAVVSVYALTDATAAIEHYGSYDVRGTSVQVRGIFYLACPEHDGLTDLHADHISVVAKGQDIQEHFDSMKFIPGALMVIAGITLLLVFYRLRESRR